MVDKKMDELRKLVEDLVAGLPDESVSIVGPLPSDANSREFVVSVAPANTASVGIEFRGLRGTDEVVVGIGSATFEYFSRDSNHVDSLLLKEICLLCQAAINGWVEETVWFRDGLIVRSRVKVASADKTITNSRRWMTRTLGRDGRKKTTQYAPYVPFVQVGNCEE